jgi:Ni,Fe-hydrogenase I large subunit
VYEDKSMDPTKRFLPRGAIFGAKGLTVVQPEVEKITESVAHSWYDSPEGLNPAQGATHMAFDKYDTNAKYSWVKAPRLDGEPMEAGPLSRMLVAYLSGHEGVKALIDSTLTALGAAGKPEVLLSLLGRVAARNLEAKLVADQMVAWLGELIEAVKGGDSKYFETTSKSEGSGAGLWEAPRGALGHFMTVKGGKIAGYQVVTPSTWDMSPRDKDGKRGPLEEALVGAPVVDPEKPMEAIRIVHSFDP